MRPILLAFLSGETPDQTATASILSHTTEMEVIVKNDMYRWARIQEGIHYA